MKQILILAIGILAACSTLSPFQNKKQINLRDYRVRTFPNGLNVLAIRDESLPYISLSAFIRAGFADDPQDATGLTSAMLNMLNKGYGGKSANQVSSEIEQIGADIDVDVLADYSVVDMNGISWQEDKLREIFSHVILKPDFNDKELLRYKTKKISEIKQRFDQIGALADEVLNREYFKGHPYGHRSVGSQHDVKKITRKQILDQYKKIVRPERMWIVLVGQWSKEFEETLYQDFGAWKEPGYVQEEKPKFVSNIEGRNILLVNRPDAAQTEIRMARSIVGRQDPDYLKNVLANTILGQGFASRLMDSIRVQQGLTYNISSDLDLRLLGSVLKIRTFTKNDSVGKMISEIYKVIEKFHQNGVTQQELDIAKSYLIGKFPALIETPEKLAFNLMVLRLYGISDDYLKNYQNSVQMITLDQVNQAILKNFDFQNLEIVVVANKEKVKGQIQELGKLSTREARAFLD